MSRTPRTTADLYQAFMASRVAARRSPNTLAWYGFILPRLVAHHPGVARIEDVEAWLATAPSAASQRAWLRCARAMYNWAGRRYGTPNPTSAIIPAEPPKKRPRVFTTTELRMVFAAAQRFGPREEAMITVLLDTGVRIGELVSLRTEDIERDERRDLDTGELVAGFSLMVVGKTGQRRVPVTAEAVRALQRIQPLSGHVFRSVKGPDRPMPVTTAKDRVRDVLTAAGLSGAKLGPHTFRHTFATMYLDAGGDIYRLQRLLGHSNIRQTQVYLHLNDRQAAAEHARLSPLVQLRRAM